MTLRRSGCGHSFGAFVIRALSFLLLIFLPLFERRKIVSILGGKPRWSVLEKYQETITHDEFTRLIQTFIAPMGSLRI